MIQIDGDKTIFEGSPQTILAEALTLAQTFQEMGVNLEVVLKEFDDMVAPTASIKALDSLAKFLEEE